ncbi:MAG: GNAT family N-acetyltransferase [Pseudomonadota bacterium]
MEIPGSRLIELIPAVEEDRAFFVACHHIAYRATVEEMFDWNEIEQDRLVAEKFDLGGTHLIRISAENVGVIGIPNATDHVCLRDFFILPAHQGGGIGRHVLARVQAMANEAGLELRLRTLRVNRRAKDFYQRYGFKLVAQDDLHSHMTWRGP